MFSKARRFDGASNKESKSGRHIIPVSKNIKSNSEQPSLPNSVTNTPLSSSMPKHSTVNKDTPAIKKYAAIFSKEVNTVSNKSKKPQPNISSGLENKLRHDNAISKNILNTDDTDRNECLQPNTNNDAKNISLKHKVLCLQKQQTSLENLNKFTKGQHDVGTRSSERPNCCDSLLKILELEIDSLRNKCSKLEHEVSEKQVELSSLEEMICIRDNLCKDLQNKLTNLEKCFEETQGRLELVKGHHALALEANESIRREYKTEIDSVKGKLEEEKQSLLNKHKLEQESLNTKYLNQIECIKLQSEKEKNDIIKEMKSQMKIKENEINAKIGQIEESASERIRLSEIQFEERYRDIQEHCSQQHETLENVEMQNLQLKLSLKAKEDLHSKLQDEVNHFMLNIDCLQQEKQSLLQCLDDLKDDFKKKTIDFENEINKLTSDINKQAKEKNKFVMSLSVTRDIVHVLTMRLTESDNEVERLEKKNQMLEEELFTYKNTLNNTMLECNEYKEALVNILKSKAALAKEHTRIMEHNVSLIESLQNVEKEAYRELGSIKTELIEDVEMLKRESNTQIQKLREEVEKKRKLALLAHEHAGQAAAAAEQSHILLEQAACEIDHLDREKNLLKLQIQDQQSVVVELSLLRQENEELSVKVATQTSIIDKMKKDMEQLQLMPKSPAVHKKAYKAGKENTQIVISPLRERNQ